MRLVFTRHNPHHARWKTMALVCFSQPFYSISSSSTSTSCPSSFSVMFWHPSEPISVESMTFSTPPSSLSMTSVLLSNVCWLFPNWTGLICINSIMENLIGLLWTCNFTGMLLYAFAVYPFELGYPNGLNIQNWSPRGLSSGCLARWCPSSESSSNRSCCLVMVLHPKSWDAWLFALAQKGFLAW